MEHRIAVLAGDGIGPEIMEAAIAVAAQVGKKYGHSFSFNEALIGGAAFDDCGVHFPDATQALCEASEAILFGAVGGPVSEAQVPKWHRCEANSLLALRKTFSFYANFRPARVYSALKDICPLKLDAKDQAIDILIVRELLGDIYFGEHKRFTQNGVRVATDVARYDETEVTAIAHEAFKAARKRSGQVTSVDKANVLDTSRLWREVVNEVAHTYPEVELQHMLVDNCAMQLVRNPGQFDVLLTPNMFGDILSDLASTLPGSLGLTPSASMNAEGFGMYEPSGGSAPDIAGRGIANPLAQILSVAMMLRFSFGMQQEADLIEVAVENSIQNGIRTVDMVGEESEPARTQQVTDYICDYIDRN
ncbi:3-isopropylmalate dehydrogenase [Oligoflexia bacterium]|nr:3-isopropylmalate dehydrogenase [Oligoflexia bacterium]